MSITKGFVNRLAEPPWSHETYEMIYLSIVESFVTGAQRSTINDKHTLLTGGPACR